MEDEKMKILLIDDDEDDRLIFSHHLNQTSGKIPELDVAESFENGIDALKKNIYDVCFIDYRLGAHTGIDILKNTHNSVIKTALIILTGVGNEELGIEALELGAADYLTKDMLSPGVIERAIRYAIARQKTHEHERKLLIERIQRATVERERQKLQQIFRQTPAIINLHEGPKHRFTLVHPRVAELFNGRDLTGLTAEEAISNTVDPGLIAVLDNVYKTGTPHSLRAHPMTFLNAESVPFVRYFDITYQPWRNSKDNVAGVITFAVDVSERVLADRKVAESEQRLRFMAESMPQKIFTTLPSGNHVDYFNKQWIEFTGLDANDIRRDGWQQFIHPEDLDNTNTSWRQSIDTGEPFQIEHRFRRFDGVYRWHLSRALPMRNKEGKITLWLGSNTDIHDIKELERQKDDFIGIASHELKTPVTSIKTYAQIMERRLTRVGDEASALNMRRIITQIDKLTSLISDLLDVTKIDSGNIRFRKNSFDFKELVYEVVGDIQLTAPTHRITVTEHANVIIEGDRERIGQVLINLLTNAVKYSPRSPDITVAFSISAEDTLRVFVHDNGLGIPPEKRDRIFDRFFRVSGPNQEAFPGFGLGLYISAEIIRRHGGKIWISREDEPGTTFYFSLPIAHP